MTCVVLMQTEQAVTRRNFLLNTQPLIKLKIPCLHSTVVNKVVLITTHIRYYYGTCNTIACVSVQYFPKKI